jgi:hypothetical protein
MKSRIVTSSSDIVVDIVEGFFSRSNIIELMGFCRGIAAKSLGSVESVWGYCGH